MEYEFKSNILKINNKNDTFKEKKLYESIPIYEKIEIYGSDKMTKCTFNGFEKEITYNDEYNLNVLDLSTDNIKVSNALEVIFLK